MNEAKEIMKSVVAVSKQDRLKTKTKSEFCSCFHPRGKSTHLFLVLVFRSMVLTGPNNSDILNQEQFPCTPSLLQSQ